MSERREIRCYDYVNRPYEEVCRMLRRSPKKLFQQATTTAAGRTSELASELRVDLAGIEVAKRITINVGTFDEQHGETALSRKTRLPLEWMAQRTPQLFPLMRAALIVYPLTSTETQLELSGHYEPPFGRLGDALDAVAGHRIAEAAVHAFLVDVAAHLRHAPALEAS